MFLPVGIEGGHTPDASSRQTCDIAAQHEFTAYGPSHWAVLAVFAAGAVLLVWLGRRQNEQQSRRFGRIAGAVTAVIYAGVLVYGLVPFDVRWSMPLQLTDLATVVTAYALWSQKHWAYAVTYYWGLVLSAQALISPALTGPDFPHYRFLAFWAIHLVVVWTAIYLTWGRGMRPRWRSYRIVVTVTLVWVAITMTFNTVAGSNYGFLNGKPSTASLLDVMGPWPWYLVVAAVLVFTVWAAMTWPWERLRQAGPMDTSGALPVNHHADHPGFSGVMGALCGLAFLLMGRKNARLAVRLAGVSENDHVVDIGCGPGSAVRLAARRGARATGVDPSSMFLRIARVVTPKSANITWVEGTAENVPLRNESATVLWSLATVHHWQDVTAGLREAHRVLAPGGRLLAIERQTEPGATGFASHGWTRQQAESFAAQCHTAGFSDAVVDSDDAGRRPVWVVRARRP